MQGMNMGISPVEAAAIHEALWPKFPEDSNAHSIRGEVLKTFHVKLDIFLAVSTYGDRPTAVQLQLWDQEL